MPNPISLSALEWGLYIPMLMIIGFLVYGWHENNARTAKTDQCSRLPLYNKTIIMLWGLSVVCVVGWLLSNRSIYDLGFQWTVMGWRGWTAWGIVGLGVVYLVYSSFILISSKQARQQARAQLNAVDLDFMRPRTSLEHCRFKILSVTAGVTEEIIFRGFLIATFSLFLPMIAAAIAAVILFGLGHIYQGVSGVLRTSLIGGVLAAIYLLGGSLWPAILFHILIDLTAGIQFQLLDRFMDHELKTETKI